MLRAYFASLFLLLGVFLLSYQVKAEAAQPSHPQRAFLEQFASSRIQFPSEDSPILRDSPGRYPPFLNFLFERVLSWVPEGKAKKLSHECRNQLWQQRLQDPRLSNSLQLQGALIQKYFQECKAEIETGDDGYLANLKNMMTMSFAPQTHPFLRRVVIGLPGNIKIKGLLALKGDMKRRPLVVVRVGIFSNIEDFKPERAWMMMLFEQSPFNVLFIESMSSADFIGNNNQFSFGGYDEGIQNILISRLMTDPLEPLSQLVDSVHLFGISLGGHGVLFASLLNKYNSPKGKALINSFTTLCPVVNLEQSMNALTHDGLFKNAMVDVWSRGRLAGLDRKLPALQKFESFGFLQKAISEIARTYRGGLSYVSSVRLPPGMIDGSDFWGLNSFWKYYVDVEQPVLIYATHQDPAVPYEMNSRSIKTKELKIESKNIQVIDLEHGVHCTLPIAYDWNTFAGLFQSYILSHSPGFKTIQRSLDVELTDEEWQGFFDAKTDVDFEIVSPAKDSSFVTTSFRLKNSKGIEKSLNLSLPLSQFDFRFLNKDLSVSERQMIVRWLNKNLEARLITKKGLPILQTAWSVAP